MGIGTIVTWSILFFIVVHSYYSYRNNDVGYSFCESVIEYNFDQSRCSNDPDWDDYR
jgi:Ni,Fe-hydrogenase I cytochrome b subunit